MTVRVAAGRRPLKVTFFQCTTNDLELTLNDELESCYILESWLRLLSISSPETSEVLSSMVWSGNYCITKKQAIDGGGQWPGAYS